MIADEDLELYEHNLVILLDTLQKVDLRQFVNDLKVNDPQMFNQLSSLIMKEMKYGS